MAPPKLVSTRGFPSMSMEGRFAQTHPVKGRAEIFVEVLCGHIHVTASDLEEIQVRALARARPGIVAPGELEGRLRSLQQNPPIEQRGSIIKIGRVLGMERERHLFINYDLIVPFFSRLVCRASAGSITVEGPAESLDTSTSCGAITVRGARGDVEALATDGEVEIQSVRGRVTISTASGSIFARDVAGPLHAATGSGLISMEQVTSDDLVATAGSGQIDLRDVSGKIRATSFSGAIAVEGKGGKGRWTLTSSCGDLTVGLPPATGVELDARTVAGTIKSLQPLNSIADNQAHLSRAGDGTLRLELTTFRGDIHIR